MSASNVVTAGHCIYDQKTKAFNLPGGTKFVIGAYDLDDPNRIERGFSTCGSLKSYTPGVATSVADIAVCKLDFPVVITDDIYPICVTPNSVGITSVTLIGIGLNNGQTNSQTRYLQYAMGFTRFNNDCNNPAITPLHICATLFNQQPEQAEQAPGDSGGPLFTISNNKYTLVGIVSYNSIMRRRENSNDPYIPVLRIPGTYTRASSFVKFMRRFATLDTSC